VLNVNTDPGIGGVSFLDYANGPHGKQFQIAGYQGGNGGTCHVSHSIRQIVGAQDVLTDVQYRGTASSNPADATYFAVGLQNSSGFLVNGAWITGYIEYNTEFYDRALVGTYFMTPPPHSHQDIMDAYVAKQNSDSKGLKVDPKMAQVLEDAQQWRQSRKQYLETVRGTKSSVLS